MKPATTREYNTLMNYLGEYTTGATRKQLMHNRDSSFLVWSIINNGFLSKSYTTRLTNIICNTDALQSLAKSCLWF